MPCLSIIQWFASDTYGRMISAPISAGIMPGHGNPGPIRPARLTTKDQGRPLNLSHEYQLVFLEDSSYSTNQVVLKTGNIYPATGLKPDSLVLLGNVNSKPVPQLFNTSFTADVWHNFAVTMDFDKKYAALLTQ